MNKVYIAYLIGSLRAFSFLKKKPGNLFENVESELSNAEILINSNIEYLSLYTNTKNPSDINMKKGILRLPTKAETKVMENNIKNAENMLDNLSRLQDRVINEINGKTVPAKELVGSIETFKNFRNDRENHLKEVLLARNPTIKEKILAEVILSDKFIKSYDDNIRTHQANLVPLKDEIEKIISLKKRIIESKSRITSSYVWQKDVLRKYNSK